MVKLLLGDEACARGAYEGGCRVACAYPGTPSTEILEALSEYKEVYCEWSTNEKVAFEVVFGAANAGARSLVAMKHVGLNVCADPLFSSAYIGVKAGMVIVTCDDPGMHSSQNEQDNRFYGLMAKLPVLCPSDSQEVKDFTKTAFEISEQFEIPVILRLTTRVAHSKSPVNLEERVELPVKGYIKDTPSRNLMPQFARRRHPLLEEKLKRLEEYSEKTPLNKIEWGSKSFGIIADGVSYLYAKDAFPKASFLKLGMVYPFPKNLVRIFAQGVKRVYVVEEVDPFIEILAKEAGVKVFGKDFLPRCEELNPFIVRNSLSKKKVEIEREEVIPRPPALCPGCPHTGIFYLLQRKDFILCGDIGCYTLGALPPHNALESCICMGASITYAHGVERAIRQQDKRRVVALIGDSTFFHMGIPGLINVGYNKGNVITIVFDNQTTGMTGHQDHPGTGKTLMGEETRMIKIEEIAKACGIEDVYILDPYQIRENRKKIREIFEKEGPKVIISRRPCALLVPRKEAKKVISDLCNGCRLCLQLGCPAIMFKEEKVIIQDAFCVGCGMCQELCLKGAIV